MISSVIGPPFGSSGPTYGAHEPLDTRIGRTGETGEARRSETTIAVETKKTADRASAGPQLRRGLVKSANQRVVNTTDNLTGKAT
ncbi:hypothetical protein GCM10010439_55710 [Actinocorallia aurantiaca]|uniref:Uncharacterized protein n=1 Tax=Actinocorallia aurantiaca TaxID=46204 RepID=A0ABN3UKQ3_9ACTN